MNIDTFRATLNRDQPPAEFGKVLAALWYQAKGDWQRAHRLVQQEEDAAGAWVHAHLHRVEGDDGNAAYWYRRAGKPFCDLGLDEEWREITQDILALKPG